MATEKRLIRYEDVYKYAFDGASGGGLEDEDFDAIVNAIEAVPTVDAVEVVHGRWEWLGPNGLVPECMCGTCSACKVRSKYIVNTDICPNCGAKMDGERKQKENAE